MANYFSSDMHSMAQRLIESAGSTMTFRVVTEGVYDLETGSLATTTADEPVKGFHSTLNTKEAQEPNLIDRKASVVLIASQSLSAAPEVGDKLVSGSDTYEVLRIANHWYKESVAVYRLVIAKL